MQYLRPYTYLFSQPEWAKSLLAQSFPLLVGSFVPFAIIGAWPVQGYFALRVNRTAGEIDEEIIPPFRIDKLGEYFSWGGWPFAYTAIQFAIWAVCYGVTYVGLFLLMFTRQRPDDTMMITAVIGWILSILFLWFALTLLAWPFLIHAYFSQKFAFRTSCRFAREFYGRVGASLFGLLVPKLVFDFLAYTLGVLVCCVGVFPAWAVIMNAELHFQMQLYRLYLSRGGTPVGGTDVIHMSDSPLSD